jgi:uncharacterized protein (TIGR01777 family)
MEVAMRVIITGGAGLIGRALTKELTQSGYEVLVLSRYPGKARYLPSNTQVVYWDGRSADGWGKMAEGAEAIVNLAGESIAGDSMLALILNRWTAQRKRSILESRLNAGKAVVQAVQLAKQKPKVVIQASAVGYYGNRGEEELTEESVPAHDFLAQICSEWEASTKQVEQLGVRRVIIRTGGVALSTEGGAFPFMLLPFRLFAGGPLGNGKQWFSWIHIADEVRAIRFLIENPAAEGVFNLCAPNSTRNGEFSRILGKVLHRPSFLPVPGFALQLAFGEKAGLLTDSQKQVPKRLLELGFTFLFPDAESALQDLLVKK